jgi:ketosteroid isomerase-like protein
MTNKETVQAYARASVEGDNETLARLRHKDWTVEWPQSGELVRSSDNFARIVEGNPAGQPDKRLVRTVGSEDRVALSPANTIVRIVGEGEAWWGEWMMTYPDGSEWHCVALMELRDGAVYRETVYWAQPLPAPDWRAGLVERDDQE